MVSTVRWSCIGRVTPTLRFWSIQQVNRSAKWMATEEATPSTMMPSAMDERHAEIRRESISSDQLSEKPVIQTDGSAQEDATISELNE